jgi:chaperonin GroES
MAIERKEIKMSPQLEQDTFETVEPIGDRILFRKDEAKDTTKGGLILPNGSETEVLTGRIVAVSAKVENDPLLPIDMYDKVLVNPSRAIPVELVLDNKLFIIPVEDVVAVFRKE